MAGPVAGLRVAEIGDLGEIAGKLLADAGADVVRVEPLHGARSRHIGPFVDDVPGVNRSLRFAYFNTNKRGITLDLSSPDGAAAWTALVGQVDVVIDALGVDVLDSAGLGYRDLADGSSVIWCSITPFGLTGPQRDAPHHDLIHMALGGIVMMCGYDDHEVPPVRPEGDHSLAIAGEYATIGVMAVLWQRLASGRGQHIDVSIHEAVAGTTEGAFSNWEYQAQNPSRKTGRHAGTAEEWQVRCADGQYVVLFGGGIPRDLRSFRALLEWMDESGAGEELRDPAYEAVIFTPPREGGEPRQQMAAAVQAFVRGRPSEEVYRRGQAAGLPWAPVRRPEQNLDDPHWADRGFWMEGPVPGFDRSARYPGAPYRFLATPLEFRRPAPDLGEHTTEVLVNDLGFEPSRVQAMR